RDGGAAAAEDLADALQIDRNTLVGGGRTLEDGGHELPPGLSSPAASTLCLPAACSSVLSGPTSTKPARSVGFSVIPAVTLSWASCGKVDARGSGARVMFWNARSITGAASVFPVSFFRPSLTMVCSF